MDQPRASPSTAWSTPATLARLAAVAVAYFALAQLGLLFSLSDSLASPIWPPAGLALAFGVLWGRRVLPAIFVGAFFVEFSGTQSFPLSLVLAAGNTAEAFLGSWLARRAGGTRAFDSLRGVLRFAGAAAAGPLPAATVGMAALVAYGQVPASAAGAVWWTWYLGDAAGALVVAPAILLLWNPRIWHQQASRMAESVATLALLVATAALVFGLVPGFEAATPALVVLLMPPLVWMAYRLGPAMAAIGLVALDALAVAVTAMGRGPFRAGSENASFLVLQAFIVTVALMALGLAALASERRRAAAFLEFRVAERTSALETLNARLSREVEERRTAEQRLDEAQKLASIGTWRWDVSQPHAVWTPELYTIYGLDPATHVPSYEDYLKRLHPDDVERVKAATEAVFRDHLPYSHDERVRRPDGTWRHLHTWAQAELDDQGKLVALIGACQDITDRIAQAKALEESLERFRALAESAPIGIVHTRADGTVDYVNGRWRQITGVVDHADGEALRRAVHPEDQARMAELWQACVREGREFKGTMRFVHGDGAVRWTSANAVPVRDSAGVITGFVSTVEDITDRLAAERKDREVRILREQAEFKTNFLRTAAHELGTPLTPIKIQMRILRDLLQGQGRDDERKAAAILERNISRLQVLVQDMLESARLQSGKLRLSVRPMDLAHTVHEVVETFQDPAIQTGIVLDTQGPHEMPMTGDPDRLSQVLYNLLSNAMKFTPTGGQIHVRLAAEGDLMRVTVQDTGAGFTEEQGAQLFQPFIQLQDPMQRARSGSGLGLYISRGIVEQHGGRLTCTSPGPGKGSTFTFVVPRVSPPALPPVEAVVEPGQRRAALAQGLPPPAMPKPRRMAD